MAGSGDLDRDELLSRLLLFPAAGGLGDLVATSLRRGGSGVLLRLRLRLRLADRSEYDDPRLGGGDGDRLPTTALAGGDRDRL